ncbi:hypothetical protein ACQJBY_053854 [Aegilops geniculata]
MLHHEHAGGKAHREDPRQLSWYRATPYRRNPTSAANNGDAYGTRRCARSAPTRGCSRRRCTVPPRTMCVVAGTCDHWHILGSGTNIKQWLRHVKIEDIKFVSSTDERFQILCYLMKFRAKTYGVNCLKDGMICSMETISLVAFQLQFMFMALFWLHGGPWGTGSNTFATTKGRLLKHEDYEERIQSFCRTQIATHMMQN